MSQDQTPAFRVVDAAKRSVRDMTPAELLQQAHAIHDQATLTKLTNFIVDRDPAEYADDRTPAVFLAADIMRDFDVMPKSPVS